jgi:hypothetical protein
VSAASPVSLPPRAFHALFRATDTAVCQPAHRCPPQPVHERCAPPAAADSIDCGLLLQEALREIDLLRSGLENAADLRSRRDLAPHRCSAKESIARHESGCNRPLYAVRPLGGVAGTPMAMLSVDLQQAIVVRVVTNLGTLLDVLI